jgi:glycosyltransferase involved in cell wall biosynthesis
MLNITQKNGKLAEADMSAEKSMFKILHCSMALTFGGEQKQLAKILTYIDRKHFQPIVCCIRKFGYVEPTIQKLASKFICLQMVNRYNLPGEVWKLRRVVKENDIGLIVTGIFGSEFSPLLTAMITRVPAVVFLTTTYDLKARSAAESGSLVLYWKSRVFYMVHAVLARLVNVRYIAYSETIKESAVKNLRLPPKSISIIPLGQDPNKFDAGSLPPDTITGLKEKLGLIGAYPILLNVARLSAVKGQKDLLEAMPEVLKHLPNARLLIAGDGTSEFTQELVNVRDKLGLQGHAQLLGHRDDIAALLHICDMFVLSSYYEGLPGSVIEAMAAAKPVVAFDIPSVRELIKDGNTGILVGERNTGQLAKSIVHLAEHPDTARQMGKRAQQIVLQKFDIRQNVKLLEAIFIRMLVHTPSEMKTKRSYVESN